MTTKTHVLPGCRSRPIGSYLQGLGVLRIVGTQLEPTATGHWSDIGFILTTKASFEEVLQFFLDEYAPTPMVSPWNKGAGYRGDGKSRAAEERVMLALSSSDDRFGEFRAAIRVAQEISNHFPDDKDFTAAKDTIISMARGLLPDAALDWVDAAVALTSDGPVYPHILGTGGNLGRLDLTSNALAHIDAVVGFTEPADSEQSERLLRDAFLGTDQGRRVKAAAGQFDPGRAGGVNTTSLGEGDALVNPWGFLLQLEGAMTFASGVTRRLGSEADSHAAMPFTVRPTTTGAGHLTPEESPKGEIWLPLWTSRATADEVRRLFSEARLRWNGRAASSGLDAARAVTSLGVDRGVPAFERTVVAERLGQSPLAVSAGRFTVQKRDGVTATAQLDGWLNRLRRLSNPPAVVADGLRAADQAMMELAHGDASSAQDLLTALARLDRAVGRNTRLRVEHAVPPVPTLDAAAWLPLLDDGSPEFRVAAAAASLHESSDDDRRRFVEQDHSWRLSVRDHVRGTVPPRTGRRLAWSRRPAENHRNVVDLLAAVHRAHATHPRTISGVAGHITTMRHGTWLDQASLEAFVAGRLDDSAILRLVDLLVLVHPHHGGVRTTKSITAPATVEPAWRILAPLWSAGRSPEIDDKPLTVDVSWPTMLSRGRTGQVLKAALVRLRTRLPEVVQPATTGLAAGADGHRLAAALFLPISPTTASRLVASLQRPDHIPNRPIERNPA